MKNNCLRCGYSWFPRVEFSRRCPKCQVKKWSVPGSKKIPRGRPSPFPVYALAPGESVLLPFDLKGREIDTCANGKKVDRIKRYSRRSGKKFELIQLPSGLQVVRTYEPGPL